MGLLQRPATRRNRAKNSCEYIDNPTECSGPPHLLGPWGSAGTGRCEWPPHDTVPGRPPFFAMIRVASWPGSSRPSTFVTWYLPQNVDARHKAGHDDQNRLYALYLILDSRN